jgi:hypothetical protein
VYLFTCLAFWWQSDQIMLKTLTFITVLAIMVSCSDNEVPEEIVENITEADTASLVQCSKAEIDAHPGTACCVSGFLKAAPGQTLSYEYYSNIENAAITWNVMSGSITIVSGQHTPVVTVKFGRNFTTGQLVGKATGTGRTCSEALEITNP